MEKKIVGGGAGNREGVRGVGVACGPGNTASASPIEQQKGGKTSYLSRAMSAPHNLPQKTERDFGGKKTKKFACSILGYLEKVVDKNKDVGKTKSSTLAGLP